MSTYQATVLADSPLLAWPMDDIAGSTTRDVSGNNNTGVLHNGPTLGVPGPYGMSAISFDGINDYLSGAINLSLYSSVSVESWVSYADSGTGHIIWEYTPNSNVGNTSSPAGFYLLQDTPATDLSWFCNLGPSYPTNNSYVSAPTPARWHHAVQVFDYSQPAASEATLYVDGLLQTLTPFGTQADHASGTVFANDFIYVMSRAGSSLFGHGSLCWFAIYPGVLSAQRVLAHYRAMVGEPLRPNLPVRRRRRGR